MAEVTGVAVEAARMASTRHRRGPGTSEVSVSRWLARARQGGPEALLARPALGPPPRLSPQQKRLIPEFLWHGAEAYGFRGEVWTCARVAVVIEEEFGVRYHSDHVSRLLKELRWTPQVPIRRAIQRDEPAIRRWRDEAWPELLRRARCERRVLVFEDESGFYLLPGPVRTYAPAGRTPILREKQSRDHLSVMGGDDPRGEGLHVGPAGVAQRNPQHRVPQALAASGGEAAAGDLGWIADPPQGAGQAVRGRWRGKIWLEALPGYAPDLNPWDEGGWNHLKNVQMRNLVCRDLEELHEEVHSAVDRLRQKPHLVRSFFAQAGLRLGKT